jgi:hypothetical protein
MKNKRLLFCLVGTVLIGGCDKQTKINTQKIETLSQRLAEFQQNQAQQLTLIQAQLKSLAPTVDKINGTYFEKNHEDELFYHTNTLLLLLTVDRKIESQLQLADTERETDRNLAYYYHTNQTDTIYFSIAQIEDAMAAQESRIENNLNTQTKLASLTLSDALLKQIQLSNEAEIARQKEIEAEVAQVQRDLDAIKSRLGITNPALNAR